MGVAEIALTAGGAPCSPSRLKSGYSLDVVEMD
jgi:hypothetical protein